MEIWNVLVDPRNIVISVGTTETAKFPTMESDRVLEPLMKFVLVAVTPIVTCPGTVELKLVKNCPLLSVVPLIAPRVPPVVESVRAAS